MRLHVIVRFRAQGNTSVIFCFGIIKTMAMLLPFTIVFTTLLVLAKTVNAAGRQNAISSPGYVSFSCDRWVTVRGNVGYRM